MLTTARWLAIISLVAVILLTSAIFQGAVGPFAQYPAISAMTTLNLIQPAVALLCLITGLLGLIAAVERRQLGWFAAILVSLIISGYGAYGVNILWSMLVDAIYRSGTNPPPYLPTNPAIYSAISGSIMPAVAAIVTLLYTFHATHRAVPSPST
jgi:hypothetical protein